jgi:hypothetical protein
VQEDAPDDVYDYMCIEDYKNRDVKKDRWASVPLSKEDRNRIDLTKRNDKNANVCLGGIRFGRIGTMGSPGGKTSEGTSVRASGSKGTTTNTTTDANVPSTSKGSQKVSDGGSSSTPSADKVAVEGRKGKHKVNTETESWTPEMEGEGRESPAGGVKSKKPSAKKRSKAKAVKGPQEGLVLSSNPDENNEGDSGDKTAENLPIIRGSCASYNYRRDVTKLIRKLRVSYLQAVQM